MNVATIVVTATVSMAKPIGLVDVLQSVEAAHPLIAAAMSDVDVARGELLSAEGAFDTYLKAKGGGFAAGYYDAVSSGVEVRQPTSLWGVELYAGYRYGADHPIYYAGKTTSALGEANAGIMIPLWKDGPTDDRRTKIQQAEAGIEIAELTAREKLLDIKLKAATSYWKWVAAHEKLRIVEEMYGLAEVRAAGIQARVDRGQLARIELIDNERLIAARLGDVIAARREVQMRAFTLSLFLRNEDGRPVIPTADRAPGAIPAPDLAVRFDDAVLLQAVRNRPEPARYDRAMTQLRAELSLAENARAPRVDLSFEGAKDFGATERYGSDPKFDPQNATDFRVALSLAWPVQQRKARGKAEATSAKLRALDAKRGFMLDMIETQVRDAWSELEAARTRVDLTRRTLDLTRQVERAERRRFELGDSGILQVNLREEASAKAAKAVVETLVEYHSADAIFRTVTGTM